MVEHRVAGAPLDFSGLRVELGVPGEFSSQAVACAQAAAQAVRLPDLDRTDLELVTVDPPGSMDLDQALHIAPCDHGYRVSYAIADVASFVPPASVLDEELQVRGETIYFPDARVPLHPTVLSEGAASLLPGQVRPAVLWQFELDGFGEITKVDVRRARVLSRARLDYAGVQASFEAGHPHAAVRLLPEVGALRLALARQRHAINLDLPAQEVERAGSSWTLRYRAPLPVESYNAEISLMTGMSAAQLMLRGGFGILRTVPPADSQAIDELRRIAPALGVAWPAGAAPGDVLAGLSRADSRQVAFLDHAASLLRGAAYVAFDGQPPEQPLHAGIGAPYAHATAPLRRLVDRYVSEICLAVQAGTPVPQWVRDRVPALPASMATADHRAHAVDRAVLDLTEAWLLRDRIGQTFAAVVLSADGHGASISIEEPAIRARCTGASLQPGQHIQARLVAADVATRTVRFELAGQ